MSVTSKALPFRTTSIARTNWSRKSSADMAPTVSSGLGVAQLDRAMRQNKMRIGFACRDIRL